MSVHGSAPPPPAVVHGGQIVHVGVTRKAAPAVAVKPPTSPVPEGKKKGLELRDELEKLKRELEGALGQTTPHSTTEVTREDEEGRPQESVTVTEHLPKNPQEVARLEEAIGKAENELGELGEHPEAPAPPREVGPVPPINPRIHSPHPGPHLPEPRNPGGPRLITEAQPVTAPEPAPPEGPTGVPEPGAGGNAPAGGASGAGWGAEPSTEGEEDVLAQAEGFAVHAHPWGLRNIAERHA